MATELGRLRHEARLSARATAVAAQELGFATIDRSRVANLESLRGRPLSVEELLGLCQVLRAFPVDVLMGNRPATRSKVKAWAAETVEVADGLRLQRGDLSAWFLYEWAPWMENDGEDYTSPMTAAMRKLSPTEQREQAMQAVRLLAEEFGLRVTFEPMEHDRG